MIFREDFSDRVDASESLEFMSECVARMALQNKGSTDLRGKMFSFRGDNLRVQC